MTISLEALRTLDHIVVHDSCSDGTASAMILKDVLPKAKVSFVQYNTPLHETLEAKPGVIFCDFSPHRTRVQDFLEAGAVVLDHHGGPAEEVTRTFAEKGLGAFSNEPGISGAVLAYQHVWLPLKRARKASYKEDSLEVADFARLIGIRDTWQRQDPDWAKACQSAEALRFWPWDTIEATRMPDWPDLLALGPVLTERNDKKVQKSIAVSHSFTTRRGRRVALFEGVAASSDVAEALGETADLVIGFGFVTEEGKPRMILSSRSQTGFNCRNLALAHGGGGHVAAAGFKIELTDSDLNPYTLVRNLLDTYETVEGAWTQALSNSVLAPDSDLQDLYHVVRTLYTMQWANPPTGMPGGGSGVRP